MRPQPVCHYSFHGGAMMSGIPGTIRLNRRGLTLVELLVTVGVLILVAAFILPHWFRLARNHDVTVCRSNIAIINAAASAYLSETQQPAASIISLVDKGYLDGVPVCAFGREYSFNGYYVDNFRDHDHWALSPASGESGNSSRATAPPPSRLRSVTSPP